MATPEKIYVNLMGPVLANKCEKKLRKSLFEILNT